LVLENNKLVVTRNAADMTEFSRTASQAFLKPGATDEEILFGNAAQPHAVLTQNFVNAIHDGEPLLAPGADGIHSLELANGMVYSSLLGQTVELPFAGAAWEEKLTRLIAASRLEKKVAPTSGDDLAGSFRK
jgi:hypothetical protein